MNKEYIYVMAACTRASLRMAGMQSKNMECFLKQKLPKYNEDAFLKVIDDEGIGFNAVINQTAE